MCNAGGHSGTLVFWGKLLKVQVSFDRVGEQVQGYGDKNKSGGGQKKTKKMASYLHRTATTIYPCCIPALGGSIGAGRIRLAGAKVGE
ncbi:MAG: hypothetical protein JWR18_673 [Segetibacter sp.]|nr:hypothetical protein [Segetibacter sp.]